MDHWIVPTNYKFFKLDDYLQGFNEIVWTHRSNFNVGDKIYIYATAPYKRLTYFMEVVRTNISLEEYKTHYDDGIYSIGKGEKVSKSNNKLSLFRLITSIPLNANLSLSNLRDHGCTSTMHSSFKVKDELLSYIQSELASSNDILIPQANDRLICFKVGKVMRESLYEMTRKYWSVSYEKAKTMTHALAVVDGIVKSVFVPQKWFLSKDPGKEKKYEFIGYEVSNSPYIGKNVAPYYGKSQNPITYINADTEPTFLGLYESPDIIENPEQFFEGATTKVSVNKYERNPKARQECIKHHGYRCKVCGMDFQETYGELGKNFIHVHHIVPISTIGKEYKLDPINDLIPVCPNCHAMLHHSNNGKVLTAEELKKQMNKS